MLRIRLEVVWDLDFLERCLGPGWGFSNQLVLWPVCLERALLGGESTSDGPFFSCTSM